MSSTLFGTKRSVFDFVKQFIADEGYPPTVRQIGEAVGLSSTATVQMHLNDLRAMGLLEGEGRSLRPVRQKEVA